MSKGQKALRRAWLVLPVLVCLLLLGTLLYTGTIWPNSIFASRYSVHGIDVSSYQKQIDWTTVARSGQVSFVFIKATEGKNYKDAYFQANWTGAKANGLLRGAYHFYTEYRTGSEQADNYISMVPKEAGMLPPVLDLEVSGKDHAVMLREIKSFLDRLQQHYGMKPMIYTDYDRYSEYVQGNFEDHPLWIRDIVTPIHGDTIKPWAFWQYCNRGHITGISGYVDLNAFYGDRDTLMALSNKRQ